MMPGSGVPESTVSADGRGEEGEWLELTREESHVAARTARAYSPHSVCTDWTSLSMIRWECVCVCMHVSVTLRVHMHVCTHVCMCLCVEEGNKMEVLNWVQRAELIPVPSMKN